MRKSIAAKHWRLVKEGKQTWVEVALMHNRVEGEARKFEVIGARLEAISMDYKFAKECFELLKADGLSWNDIAVKMSPDDPAKIAKARSTVERWMLQEAEMDFAKECFELLKANAGLSWNDIAVKMSPDDPAKIAKARSTVERWMLREAEMDFAKEYRVYFNQGLSFEEIASKLGCDDEDEEDLSKLFKAQARVNEWQTRSLDCLQQTSTIRNLLLQPRHPESSLMAEQVEQSAYLPLLGYTALVKGWATEEHLKTMWDLKIVEQIMTIGRDRYEKCFEAGKCIGKLRHLARQVQDGVLTEECLMEEHGKDIHFKVMTSGMNSLQGAFKGSSKSGLQAKMALDSRKRLCATSSSVNSLPSTGDFVEAICSDHPDLSFSEARKCLNRTTGLWSRPEVGAMSALIQSNVLQPSMTFDDLTREQYDQVCVEFHCAVVTADDFNRAMEDWKRMRENNRKPSEKRARRGEAQRLASECGYDEDKILERTGGDESQVKVGMINRGFTDGDLRMWVNRTLQSYDPAEEHASLTREEYLWQMLQPQSSSSLPNRESITKEHLEQALKTVEAGKRSAARINNDKPNKQTKGISVYFKWTEENSLRREAVLAEKEQTARTSVTIRLCGRVKGEDGKSKREELTVNEHQELGEDGITRDTCVLKRFREIHQQHLESAASSSTTTSATTHRRFRVQVGRKKQVAYVWFRAGSSA